MQITIDIPIEPVAQKRHRHTSRGNFVTVYDPSKKDKENIANLCRYASPLEPFSSAVSVDLTFWFERPKSHFGTGKNANKVKVSAPVEHTKKPDIDNLQKILFDALNGVFWSDDSIITQVNAKKLWSASAGHIRIAIKEVDSDDSQL